MVAIHPFAALRYNPERVGDLSSALAPPYDVIGPEEQDRLYQASPHNIVRLTLAKTSAADSPNDNRYTRAQRDFNAWRADEVLCLDSAPALYVIAQTFDDGGTRRCRLGFIALLGLDEATRRGVLRHEATLAAPKEDRTKLLEAVPANLEPIFCVYPDDGGTIQAILEQLSTRPPTVQTTFTPPHGRGAGFKGDEVRVWVVTEPTAIREVTGRLASASALIADGHHRFEVACAHRERYGALMTYFVSMADPSLVMRPIHRMVEGAGAVTPDALRALCSKEPASDAAALLEWLHRAEGQGCFGYADQSGLSRVSVEPRALARWLMTPSVPQPLAALDVSILHGLILPQAASHIRYTADASQALEAVRSGRHAQAWLLRPIPLQQVWALAAQGFTLAPKSTYFYPKIPSGLTIHALASTGARVGA